MAGTNFKKLKGGAVMAMINHDCRENENYSNTDIDLTKADTNQSLCLKGFSGKAGMRKRYLDRMEKVEETNTNKRKDRVNAISLLFNVPEGMGDRDARNWMMECAKIVGHKYGWDNYIGGVGHFDEVHEYVDPETKETKLSRTHAHILFVPEHEGQLNGKWCSSRMNMIDLNNMVQAMTEQKFPGYTYMTGTGKKSRKTVEQLKNESDYTKWELEAEKMKSEAENFRFERDNLETEVTGLKSDKKALQDEIEALQTDLDETLRQYDEITAEVEKLVKRKQDLDRKIAQSKRVLTEQQKQDYETKQKEFERKMQMLQGHGIEIER